MPMLITRNAAADDDTPNNDYSREIRADALMLITITRDRHDESPSHQ